MEKCFGWEWKALSYLFLELVKLNRNCSSDLSDSERHIKSRRSMVSHFCRERGTWERKFLEKSTAAMRSRNFTANHVTKTFLKRKFCFFLKYYKALVQNPLPHICLQVYLSIVVVVSIVWMYIEIEL